MGSVHPQRLWVGENTFSQAFKMLYIELCVQENFCHDFRLVFSVNPLQVLLQRGGFRLIWNVSREISWLHFAQREKHTSSGFFTLLNTIYL